MTDNINFKELSLSDAGDGLLDDFIRYQKVTRHWKKINEEWVLKDGDYVDDWDRNERKVRAERFINVLTNELGHIFGAYADDRLVGFAVLLKEKFGSNNQYIQLKSFHVSLDYRDRGIGKKLFKMCEEKAREIGAEKMYISANDSEATQGFYLGLGCVDAREINQECAAAEPFDRQMEFSIADITDIEAGTDGRR